MGNVARGRIPPLTLLLFLIVGSIGLYALSTLLTPEGGPLDRGKTAEITKEEIGSIRGQRGIEHEQEITGSAVITTPPAAPPTPAPTSDAISSNAPSTLRSHPSAEDAPGFIIEFTEAAARGLRPRRMAAGGNARTSGQATGMAAVTAQGTALFDRAAADIASIKAQTGLGKVHKMQASAAQAAMPEGIPATPAAEPTPAEPLVMREYAVVFKGMAVNVPAEAVADIKKLDYVKKVYPNRKVYPALTAAVPLIGADQAWLLDAPGKICDRVSGNCVTGTGVTVAVIDSGIDYTHPDFGSCTTAQFKARTCAKVIGGKDFENNDDDPIDDAGHGTHVAGIIAAKGKATGVAPDARLIAYKVLSANGAGTSSNVIAAIEAAADPNSDGDTSDHHDIVSISLGTAGLPDDPMSTAADTAVSKGVITVIAAGNIGSEPNAILSPGRARAVITVGATGKSGDSANNIAGFSSRGPVVWDITQIDGEGKTLNKPDIVAPGDSICSTKMGPPGGGHCIDDAHIEMSGTSMATPMVSGIAALIKQRHKDWTPQQVKQALKGTALDLGFSPSDQGSGRADALQAATLETPLPLALLGQIDVFNGTMNIFGTTGGPDFSEYTIYAENNGKIAALCRSSMPVHGNLCSNVDISRLPDGKNTIRLESINTQGRVSTDRATVTIKGGTKEPSDTTPPSIKLVIALGSIAAICGDEPGGSGCDDTTLRIQSNPPWATLCPSTYPEYTLSSPLFLQRSAAYCAAGKDTSGNTGFTGKPLRYASTLTPRAPVASATIPGPITTPTNEFPTTGALDHIQGSFDLRLIPSWDFQDNKSHGILEVGDGIKEGSVNLIKLGGNFLFFEMIGPTGQSNDILLEAKEPLIGTSNLIFELFKPGKPVDIHASWYDTRDGSFMNLSLNGKLARSVPTKDPPIFLARTYRIGIAQLYASSGSIHNVTLSLGTMAPASDLRTPSLPGCEYSCSPFGPCLDGRQVRGCMATNQPCANTTTIPDTVRKCASIPPCAYTCGQWGPCLDGTQTRYCSAIGLPCSNITSPMPPTRQACTPPPCTYICSPWSACANGGQTRSCSTTNAPCSEASAPSPPTYQSCLELPPCAYTCGPFGPCIDGTRHRECPPDAIPCSNLTSRAPPTTEGCEIPPPPCVYSCTEYGSCIDGKQYRTCASTNKPCLDSPQQTNRTCVAPNRGPILWNDMQVYKPSHTDDITLVCYAGPTPTRRLQGFSAYTNGTEHPDVRPCQPWASTGTNAYGGEYGFSLMFTCYTPGSPLYYNQRQFVCKDEFYPGNFKEKTRGNCGNAARGQGCPPYEAPTPRPINPAKVWMPVGDYWGPPYCTEDWRYSGPKICETLDSQVLTGKDCSAYPLGLVVKTFPTPGNNYRCEPNNIPRSTPARTWKPSNPRWGPPYCDEDWRYAGPKICPTPDGRNLQGQDCGRYAYGLEIKTAYDINHNFKCLTP